MTQVLGRLKLDGRAKPVRPGGALHDVTPLQNLAKTLVFIRFYKGFLQGLGKMSNPAFHARAAGSSSLAGMHRSTSPSLVRTPKTLDPC